MRNPTRTLSLNEAANFLHINKETARRLAVRNKIPAAKVGRSWVFIERDLEKYIRSLYSNDASQGVIDHRSKEIWHSTKETTSIGLTSTTKVCEYNKQLGLATK